MSRQFLDFGRCVQLIYFPMWGPKSLIERLLISCPEDPLTVSSSLGRRRRVFRPVAGWIK